MDRSKSVVRITIIAMLIIGILTTTILGAKVTITADTLKLRKEPSSEAPVIELLSQDEEYEVIEELDNWYKIKYEDTEGYISKDYAVKEGENVVVNNTVSNVVENTTTNENTTTDVTNTTTNTTTAQDTTSETVKIAIEDIDVRISPLVNSCIIENLKKDTEVKIISSVRGWDYIETETYCGWVRSEKLKVKEDTTVAEQENNQPETPAVEATVNETIYDSTKKMYVKSTSINVREKPDKNSTAIDSAVQNAEITVTGENGDWYKVTIGGKDGYILKSLLSTTKIETTSRSTNIDRNATTATKKVEEVSASATGSARGSELVSIAKQYLGCKYVYGGSGPSTFDCSGFTMFLYSKYGYSLPHSATSQSYKGVYVSKENLAPGDLVIFNNSANTSIGHVGVYIGGNQFIHASSGKGKVIISGLSDSYYAARYVTARRIF